MLQDITVQFNVPNPSTTNVLPLKKKKPTRLELLMKKEANSQHC